MIDTPDTRALAEFYRRLLGLEYRAGDEPPDPGEADINRDWLMLLDAEGRTTLAFQFVERLPAATWPDETVPQQLHLDFSVPTVEGLVTHHGRALSLGARLLLDRRDDPDEPLYVYSDPSGHPFCIFVAAEP